MKNTISVSDLENGVWIGPNAQSGTDGENRENTKMVLEKAKKGKYYRVYQKLSQIGVFGV
jgi:hypothetical protein